MRYIAVVGTHINGGETGVWVRARVISLIERLFDEDPFTIIVSGGAPGVESVDTIAELTARRIIEEYRAAGVRMHNPIIFKPEVHPPGHPRAGKWVSPGAGPMRNSKIVDTAVDGVYAVWNGVSHGTLDSIKKALKKGRLTQIIFTNGLVWEPTCGWDPITYGESMEHQFDNERLAHALTLRLRANRKSKLNLYADGSPNEERLAYADGRTIHAFNSLVQGVRPTQGIGEQAGLWFVPSENKKPDVRPHCIGEDGWCDCDSITRGRKVDGIHGSECFAMYLLWIYQKVVAPEGLPEIGGY